MEQQVRHDGRWHNGTAAQFAEYRARHWIQQDVYGRWGTWYARLPPDPAASFAPERVKCACLDCSATFLWVPESLQLYHAPACQQRARIERRHTPAAIRAKAEYDHQRYLARKPQLNHARNERRRRAWLAVIVAMPPGRPGARPSDASIVAATATTVAANPTPKRTIPYHQASRLRPRSPGRHVGGSMTHAIH